MPIITTQNNDQIPLKQRKSKQRKERYWKQKRSKYSQKRRKYRKRRRYAAVKIRNINKQFKRIKNKLAVQNWWWKQFIPSIQASNEALWQIERDKLIQQKLSQLSISSILERDTLNKNQGAFNALQIGNKDFKPLALPDTLNKIQLTQTNQDNSLDLLLQRSYPCSLPEGHGLLLPPVAYNSKGCFDSNQKSVSFGNNNENTIQKDNNSNNMTNMTNNSNENFNLVNKLYTNLFIDENTTNQSFSQFLMPNTNLPFYAGWDESLRKLIVTNRMLSRKDAGFTLTKLQGMNAATTLYWQIPFTTYDPDQFFALGMDGFSPIGWRKFLFRHSILKTWLDSRFYSNTLQNSQKLNTIGNQKNLNQAIDPCFLPEGYGHSKGCFDSKQNNSKSTLIVKNRYNILSDLAFGNNKTLQNFNLNNYSLKANLIKQYKNNFANSRRLKKRYRRVKKHPRTPVWFPSGSLSNQVLPVHYIYVFYKR
jgi:hypothetical protein